MSMTATTISQGCLQDLYLQKGSPKNSLILQLLAFQTSQNNPKEIILRISDKQAFLDCLLVGPYTISKGKIVSTQYSHSSQSFKPLDIIKVVDYFCKIDLTKICHLKIIIRKIEEHSSSNEILGRPEQISQFVENNNIPLRAKTYVYDNQYLISAGKEDTPIKIEQNAELPTYSVPKPNNEPNKINFNQQNVNQSNSQKSEQTLSLQDIMNNKQGFFIGRLVRFKFGSKEAKDGPMSFLCLGFLDINGDIVRVHLAGRIAIKQSRELKKGKVYFIKGLQLFQGDKSKGGPQIRLRQKEYRIQQIQNQVIKSQYKQKYYRWEHQNQWIESQMVDVIGIVQGIQQKITYKNANTFQEQREVVRLIIRNAFKTVRISFWADHINLLNNFNLQKKQPIVIEDIKKKKTVFLDFISESNIIILDEQSQIREEFQHFFPPLQEAPEPTNVKQLLQVYEHDPFNNKIITLILKLQNINSKWIIYKMCNECKKKVEKILQICPDCNKQSFCYKYNCYIDLSDISGTISSIAFDPICEKLFGQTANEFSLLSEQQKQQLIQVTIHQEYRVSLEHKNNRIIIRLLQKLTASDIIDTLSHNISSIQVKHDPNQC